MRSTKSTRRRFLSQTTKAAAGAIVAPHIITSTALGNATTPPASERIAVGHVGVGGQGGGLLGNFLRVPDCQVIGISDCFKDRRDTGVRRANDTYADRNGPGTWKGCEGYPDFRDLLARDDLDAVVVATPDHWHVPVGLAAARAGKDMYIEKPLGLCINWNKALREAVHRHGLIFQYGTQQRGSRRCAFGCELVVNGRIGEIKEIHVEAPCGFGGRGSTTPIPVPEGFDYDMWLGPAPLSPYTRDRCTSDGSWFVYDNSIGFLGGWGAHPLDLMHWAYPEIPVEYEGTGEIVPGGIYDVIDKWDVKGRFANGVEFTFKGYNQDETFPDTDKTTFVGEDGWVAVSRGVLDAHPKSLLTSIIKPDEIHLYQDRGHYQNFIDSIKTRAKSESPIDTAVQSDYVSHLSDIAIRTGHKITWDPEKEEIVSDDIASRMLTRAMRSPWRL